MEQALSVLRGLGSPLLVHAESAEAAAAIAEASGRRYADYLASRPRGIENLAVAQVIEAAAQTGGHAHIVHLSSSDALPMIASARREGVRLTAETCPHYLTLAAEEIADGATAFKCSPPVREAANRELLWDGLRDGILDMIVSDHSPVHASDEGTRQRRLRRRLGRHLLAAAGAAGRLDAGTPPGVHAGRRGRLDGASAGRGSPACPARGGSRPGSTPTSASSHRMSASPSTRPGCTTGIR